MEKTRFSLKKRILSFQYAFNGLRILIRDEHNVWIHLIVLAFVIFAGFYFNISNAEWMWIAIVSGFVLAMEAMNTAIENLSNYVMPERHRHIKASKDLGAAAVLISAVTAATVGVIIFLPKIIDLCSAC